MEETPQHNPASESPMTPSFSLLKPSMAALNLNLGVFLSLYLIPFALLIPAYILVSIAVSSGGQQGSAVGSITLLLIVLFVVVIELLIMPALVLTQIKSVRGETVGLNCAACHNGQLNYKGKKIRIEGGINNAFDSMAYFFAADDAMQATLTDAAKFDRLATRIGAASPDAKAQLRKAWVDVAKARADCDAAQDGDVRAEAEPIQSQFVARAIRKALPKNGILVVDAGNGGKHVRTYFRSYEPGTFMCIDDWASVGEGKSYFISIRAQENKQAFLCELRGLA